MTDMQAQSTPTDAAELKPLLGLLDLAGDAAGTCSGGVCHVPVAPAQKDPADRSE